MYQATHPLIAVLMSLSVAVLVGQIDKIDFEKDQVGKAPAGWTATQTGTGAATWTIVQDSTAPSPDNSVRHEGAEDQWMKVPSK
jgi:hypothetical protein